MDEPVFHWMQVFFYCLLYKKTWQSINAPFVLPEILTDPRGERFSIPAKHLESQLHIER